MKKVFSVFIVLLLIPVFLLSQDVMQKIRIKGEKEWKKLLNEYTKQNVFVKGHSAADIAANFDQFKGKYMIFPKVDFTKSFTDRNNVKYFYCDEKGFDGFVIEYNNEITEKLRKYSYVIGNLSSENWELLGKIEDCYSWWNNVVFLKIAAIRVPGKVTAIVKQGKVNFIGENFIDEELKKKAADSGKDIPKNLASIPKGLDPLMVAKLFFYIGSEEKNKEVWSQLLTKDWSDSKIKSVWRLVAEKNRKYYYVRIATDDASKKKYFFQRQVDGKDLGSPGPITLIKEGGEWRVDSASP